MILPDQWPNLLSTIIFYILQFGSFFVGQCSNKECPFLHLNPEDKIKDCPWYDRGFCKHGMCVLQIFIQSNVQNLNNYIFTL